MRESKKARDAKKKASALGRRGGKVGGKARAAALSADERAEQARLAAQARWDRQKGITRAIADGTIDLAGTEIDCAVLPGEVRVLSQRTVATALGRFRPGGKQGGAMPTFLSAKNLQPFVDDDLRDALTNPILYRKVRHNLEQPAHGIPADVLADICVVFIDAEKAGALKAQQMHLAAKATILHRALAKVGITALVDEATGYQYQRARDALALLLEQWVDQELARWVKTFPDEYYEQMARLRKIKISGSKRPILFAKLTADIVYDRLVPSLKEELKRKNPADEHGRRKHKHHQWLTRHTGFPALKEHIGKVVGLMTISSTWREFIRHLDKVAPKVGTTLEIDFDRLEAELEDEDAEAAE